MSITPQTLSAIQQAGEAIDAARHVLAQAVTEHAQRVMGAIKHDPTSRDNEKALEDWKALTQLAREVETVEQQFRSIYFTAEQMVMPEVQVLPALTHQATSPKAAASVSDSSVQDVIAKPLTMKAKTGNKATATVESTLPPSRLSKNDKKVLDHLVRVLSSDNWTYLTLREIAEAAGIPNGSSDAAVKRLLKSKRIELGTRGLYRLV